MKKARFKRKDEGWKQHCCYCTRVVAEDLVRLVNPQFSLEALTDCILETGKGEICQVVRAYLLDGTLSLFEVKREIAAGYELARQKPDQNA